MISIEAVSRFKWSRELGERLKSLRTTRKISRASLVAEMAVNLKLLIKEPRESRNAVNPDTLSPKYIERLEKGETDSIALESLQSISRVLGVGADDLLGGDVSIKITQKDT